MAEQDKTQKVYVVASSENIGKTVSSYTSDSYLSLLITTKTGVWAFSMKGDQNKYIPDYVADGSKWTKIITDEM